MFFRRLTITLLTIIVFPVFAADFSAPIIESVSKKAPDNTDTVFKIEAVVFDDGVIDTVKFFYRPLNQTGNYYSLSMRPSSNNKNVYSVELSDEISQHRGIEYYVEARDIANNIAQEPHPKEPSIFKFNVDDEDPPPPPGPRFYVGSQWGAGISYGSYSVDDPDGDTGDTEEPSYSVIFNHGINPDWRLWFELGSIDFILPYGETQIGQEVKGVTFDASIQGRVPLSKHLVWIGVGVSAGQIEIIDRATAVDGVIVDSFEDRDITDVGYFLEFGYELGPINDKMIGIHGKMRGSSNEGVNSATIGLFVTFR